jgi:hypothetical protein
MARVLIAGDERWYDELRAVAYYSESELENWILQHAKSIFPDHFAFPFKKDIFSQTISKRPDLALIQRDFSAWVVVEVEVEGHGVNHVLEQTRVFVGGNYNLPEIAEYAQKQLVKFCNKTASLKRLGKLFSEYAPSVLVIAEAPAIAWQQGLKDAGVDFCVFEVYKNVVGQYVYRTLGKYPVVPVEEAHCRPHKQLPNMFEVVGDIEFKRLRKGRQIEVVFDENLTQWALIEEKGQRYLRFVGTSNPLSPNATYGLFRDKSHRYSFVRS